MKDKENIGDETEEREDTNTTITYTQVASCIYGPAEEGLVDRRRHTLRAKLEREQYEREIKKQKSIVNTFRNLFSTGN